MAFHRFLILWIDFRNLGNIVHSYSDGEVLAHAANKNLIPGTLLWAADMLFNEDAFRSGAKNSPAVDFLRWQDIGLELTKGKGRIPQEEWATHMVKPGKGVSMFIKRMLPEGMMFLGTVVDADKKALKVDFDPIIEKF